MPGSKNKRISPEGDKDKPTKHPKTNESTDDIGKYMLICLSAS